MEAIKLIGTSHDGKLTVAVPKEFDDKELELMIISSKDKKEKEEEGEKKERNITELMSILGAGQTSGFSNDKV